MLTHRSNYMHTLIARLLLNVTLKSRHRWSHSFPFYVCLFMYMYEEKISYVCKYVHIFRIVFSYVYMYVSIHLCTNLTIILVHHLWVK